MARVLAPLLLLELEYHDQSVNSTVQSDAETRRSSEWTQRWLLERDCRSCCSAAVAGQDEQPMLTCSDSSRTRICSLAVVRGQAHCPPSRGREVAADGGADGDGHHQRHEHVGNGRRQVHAQRRVGVRLGRGRGC